MHPVVQNIKKHIRIEHVMLAILILAILLRFAFPDLKLFHHDEAIHAWFSYQLLTTGSYLYDPVYHGPFLYYITASMFAIFGDSDITGRILPALAGCALIPLVYWLYRLRYLSGKVAVIAWLQKGHWYYLALAGAAGAFGMCSKENMPLILVTFAVFVLYLLWSRKITLPKKWIRDAIIALIIFFGIIFTMYSSFWTHPEMILQAGPLAIEHWISMHNEQRIAGPPVFYILMFILYEPVILLLGLLGVILFLITGRKKTGEPKEKFSLARLFRRPAAPVSVDRKTEFIRFAIYWTLIACLTYAYIGEKVPWLSLHQLVPMIFVAAYALTFAGKYWKIILAVCAVILLAITFHVVFTPADIAEPIVQVQNSEDLTSLMEVIDKSDKVVLATDQAWPFMWYYRGDSWDRFTYYGALVSESTIQSGDYDVVITHDSESFDSLDGYAKETIRLNYWINWEDTAVNPGWIPYYFTRAGQIGSYNIDVFTKTVNTTI
jgi:predicted membrane-bound mannosyltransferase